MPQMMPMNWIFIPLLMFFMIMLTFINLTFMFSFTPQQSHKILFIKKNKIWMW